MQRSNGFTLMELMIVIAIVAILVGIAFPNFQTMMQNGRITSALNSQLGFLQLARSEAVKRRANITVCGSNDQATCTSNWEEGVVMLQGANVLKVLPPAATGVEIRGAGNSLTYRPDGTLFPFALASLSVCDDRREPSPNLSPSSRSINITPIGQASSGGSVVCP